MKKAKIIPREERLKRYKRALRTIKYDEFLCIALSTSDELINIRSKNFLKKFPEIYCQKPKNPYSDFCWFNADGLKERRLILKKAIKSLTLELAKYKEKKYSELIQ